MKTKYLYFNYVKFNNNKKDIQLNNIFIFSFKKKNKIKKVKEIIQNAQSYTREYLQPNHILCYHAKFFKAYSLRFKSKVRILDGMEHVKNLGDDENNNNNNPSCICEKPKSSLFNLGDHEIDEL